MVTPASVDDISGSPHGAGADMVEHVLLGAPACDRVLPISTIVRELTFGRFITLADGIAPTTAFRVRSSALTMPLSMIDVALTSAGPEPPSVLEAAEQAVEVPNGKGPEALEAAADPEPRDANAGDLDASEAPPLDVRLASIADFLSRRTVSVPVSEPGDEGRHDRVEERRVILAPEMVTRLVTEGKADVVLRDGSRVVHIDATGAADAPPRSEGLLGQYEIPNVAAFLSMPTVPTTLGGVTPVRLEPGHVRDLLDGNAVTVTVEGTEISLEPRSRPGPSTAGPPGVLSSSFAAESLRAVAPSTEVTATVAPPLATTTVSDSSPGKVAAPGVGFYIPYRQRWTLLGYERGALLNTISLAPQEETTIELFTWDRRTNALEQTSASEVEQNIESTDATKDTQQVLSELTHDSNFKADANFDIHAKLEVVNVGGGGTVGGGTSAKEVAKTTTDYIHEQTTKAVTRVKASRQSKVSETHEFGHEERTTRHIKNVNMCNAFNLDYFEVLVDYEMSTVCMRQEAQLVVLLDPPEVYDWHSRDTIRRFESVLRQALLDRAFVDGFDAARLLAARECAFAAVCERSICADDAASESGPVSEGTEFDDVRQAALGVMSAFRWFFGQGFDRSPAFARYAFLNAAPPTPDDLFTDPTMQAGEWLHLWLFVRLLRDKAPSVWAGLASLAPIFPTDATQITPKQLATLHIVLTPKGPVADLASLLTIDPQTAAALKGALHQVAFELYKDIPSAQAAKDFATQVNNTIPNFVPGSGLVKAINDLAAQGAAQGFIELAVELAIQAVDQRFGISDVDDKGLMTAITIFDDAFDTWQKANADLLRAAADTAQALDTLANQRDDQIRSAFPLSQVAPACEREGALMMHLADNDAYYTFAVYQSRLSSESASLPLLVTSSQGLIMPNAIGMVNGKLAFPVNFDAVGLNPQNAATLQAWFDTEIRNNTELDQSPEPTTVSLPTPGITLETRLGVCAGCDHFIRKTREIDLRQKTAKAEQEEAEAKRRAARLDGATPDLDDPVEHDPVITVQLVQVPQPQLGVAPAQAAAGAGGQPAQPAG